MPLRVRSVRVGSPRKRGEGLRIGAVRFLPRGVRKGDYAAMDFFDVWLPTLAPSRRLLSTLRSTSMSPKTFFRRYRSEMQKTEPRQTIKLLAELARQTPISVCCYCADESRCHRSVLIRLIRQAASSKVRGTPR